MGPCASRGGAGWLGDWAAEGHPCALAGGTLAQPPAAAAEAAFGRSRQSLSSPVLTRAALPHAAIITHRNQGPERPQSAMATDTVRGLQGPGPASARGQAPLASGPGLRQGKEPAPWTEGGHASKTAPKLGLEGPSAPPAPAKLRPRGSGGEAQGPQADGRPGRDSSPVGCRGVLGA